MLIKPLSKHGCINQIQGVPFPPLFSKPAKYNFQIQEQNPRYNAHYSRQVTSNYLEIYVSGFHPVFLSTPSRDLRAVAKDEC